MDAAVMASGRMPSMDRIMTRRARGAGVGVAEGKGVSVGGWVAVTVAVRVGGCVAVAVAVGGTRGLLGTWQASRSRMETTDKTSLRTLFESIVMDSLLRVISVDDQGEWG
jgi:hypothetical protein